MEIRGARWPALSKLFQPRWFAKQGGMAPENRSPLFSWLGGSNGIESEEFCRSVEGAIATLGGLPGVAERLDRLKGPATEFWSALCELYMASFLTASGLPTTLHPDTPDLRVHFRETSIGVELTAGFPNLPFAQLQTAATEAWSQPGRLILLCPDETHRFLTTERDALVERLSTVDIDSLTRPTIDENDVLSDGDVLYAGIVVSRDDLLLPTDDIIDPTNLQVLIGPAPYPFVVTRSGARFGYRDPWPRMVVAAQEKARKLPTDEIAVVAFESGYMHTTSRIWADIVARGEVALELCLPDHIAAILVYWQDARTRQPVWPLLV